jgi:hypothetical protein
MLPLKLTIVQKVLLMEHQRNKISLYNGLIIRLERKNYHHNDIIPLLDKVKTLRVSYKSLWQSLGN